jgi:capsular exopolysaccharide synthesis family protein
MTLNLVTLIAPGSPAAEAYRGLRLNLMAAGREAPLCTVLVAPASPSPDKGAPVANLAVAYAQIGKRVILVDCDLRHPTQHTLFGLSNATGLAAAVHGSGTSPSLQETGVANLRLLTAGPAMEAPGDLLASSTMARLIAQLAGDADIVLFDAPPVTVAPDAVELATQVDGVLLTVTAGVTKRDEALQAKELLERIGARVVGAALVNVAGSASTRKYLAA